MSDNLIIGKRYWLDNVRDVSGLYMGYDGAVYRFNELEGDNTYATNEDGSVSFSIPYDFHLVEPDINQELVTRLHNLVNEFSKPEWEVWCDHSVGICACTAINVLDEAKQTLSKIIK